jgi:hypothetical protein
MFIVKKVWYLIPALLLLFLLFSGWPRQTFKQDLKFEKRERGIQIIQIDKPGSLGLESHVVELQF